MSTNAVGRRAGGGGTPDGRCGKAVGPCGKAGGTTGTAGGRAGKASDFNGKRGGRAKTLKNGIFKIVGTIRALGSH